MGEYRMDAVLSAVADPTRRAILDRLRTGEARVTELASAFPISLNSTSKHIKVLERAELVHRSVRGRDHVLSLRAEPLGEALAWMERYREFWEQSLANLEAFVLGDILSDSEELEPNAPADDAPDSADPNRADPNGPEENGAFR